MSKAAANPEFAPVHAIHQRPGPKRQITPEHLGLPPWSGWTWTAEHKHIIRWIEDFLVVPTGILKGEPMRVAKFQRDLLRRLCDSAATFISIPTGNGKTGLMAAVALERLTRGDHYVEISILATREDQARRLLSKMIQFVESSPQLAKIAKERGFEFYKDKAVYEYRATGSTVTAYPATLSAIQGLASDLTLIDEVGMVPPELVTSMISRLVKHEMGHVVGFGTPGFEEDNMLEALRKLSHESELPPLVDFIEYAADAGCDVMDAEQHRKANPAIDAGFLNEEMLKTTIAVMVGNGEEAAARAYHLGQPIGAAGPWLPFGAWEGCVDAGPPRDGVPVVLAVWGNYKRQTAIVGATLDGAVFFGWQAEKPSDGEVEAAIRQAGEQWELLEVCHKPHIRLNLFAKLLDEGLPIEVWPNDAETDKNSTAELWQAIANGTIAHDHSETLAEQVARLTAKVDRNGNPRLVESEQDVAAALAMRAAWWRARILADAGVTEEVHIF